MAPGKLKKEKIFHPQSRKAAQIERSQLRKAKITEVQAKKVKRAASSSTSSKPLTIIMEMLITAFLQSTNTSSFFTRSHQNLRRRF